MSLWDFDYKKQTQEKALKAKKLQEEQARFEREKTAYWESVISGEMPSTTVGTMPPIRTAGSITSTMPGVAGFSGSTVIEYDYYTREYKVAGLPLEVVAKMKQLFDVMGLEPTEANIDELIEEIKKL